jgi:hypothetical protein
MTARTALATAAVAAITATFPGHAALQRRGFVSAEERAAKVAATFLRSINARRFERTCSLLSVRFYREQRLPGKARCVLVLRIGFTWAPTYRFEIASVRMSGERAVVATLANGVPGRLVLVPEAGNFRVLSVDGP